jgi:N utilization substance protein B
MGQRRKAREHTLRILFQMEFEDSIPNEALDQYWKSMKTTPEIKEYSTWLAEGIASNQKTIDSLIQSVSKNWRISRMALIDRNILRMAVFELLYEDDIAPAIIINEAIEIARRYSGDEAATFVNGILDAVRKSLEKEKKQPKERRHG